MIKKVLREEKDLLTIAPVKIQGDYTSTGFFYALAGTGASLLGGDMVKHFAPKVIDGKVFIVWRKKPELGEGSPVKKVHEYQSYLRASLKAYIGNCKIASAEAQFAGVKQ